MGLGSGRERMGERGRRKSERVREKEGKRRLREWEKEGIRGQGDKGRKGESVCFER